MDTVDEQAFFAESSSYFEYIKINIWYSLKSEKKNR